MSFFQNTRKPRGLGGKIMVAMMNSGHATMANWGFQFLTIPKDAIVLDCGCGGGANVMDLPFEQYTFDIVTAFETIYFWPDLLQSFGQVYSVLKSGGTFFICNESNGDTNKDDKWVEKIGGMTIYNGTQIKAVLEQAGFSNIRIEKNEKGWLCVTAEK